MPVSQETAARADKPLNTPILDEGAYRVPEPGQQSAAGQSGFPSDTAQPTVVDTAPQQAATQPVSGTEVADPNAASAQPLHVPSFKEKVIGRAKEIRGTALRKPDTKEQGQRILRGEEVFEPKKIGPGARRSSTSSQGSSD